MRLKVTGATIEKVAPADTTVVYQWDNSKLRLAVTRLMTAMGETTKARRTDALVSAADLIEDSIKETITYEADND